MAHPYESHKEAAAGKSRASEFTKGYKKGGAVHSDEAQDRKLIKKIMKSEEAKETKVEGRSTGGRLDKFARGGATKSKSKGKRGNTVNIAIVSPQGGPPAPAGAAPAAPVGLPPPGGGMPPGLPPKPPMGVPPGGPMGGPPGMMNRGGRAYKNGGKVPMKAGAETGQGRKEKARAYGLKPIKGKDE